MSKYTTLVFKNDTAEQRSQVNEISKLEICRAWSMDHEIVRLELIEKALDENNIELAKSYFGMVDIDKLRHVLEE